MRDLAAEQHALVSRAQVRSLGASTVSIAHRLRGPSWDLATARVLRLRGAPPTQRQRLMAAVLDAGEGAVASHFAAAALWGLRGFRHGPLDVSLARHGGRPRRPFGIIHESAWLPRAHVTSLYGIPVTTPARTLFGLAGLVHPQRAALAVDAALGRNPRLLPVLRRMLPELAAHGRAGIVAMRAILEERDDGYVAPASGLECRAIQILDEAGIETRRQVDLGGEDWIGRVDLVVVGAPLVIEIDSVLHHTARTDRERDALRDAGLKALGFDVVRIAQETVWGRPGEVAATVRAALSFRRA